MSDVPVDAIRQFIAERDWQAFHDPKNLTMALGAEVGELTALFQWLSPAESDAVMDDQAKAEHVRHEIADVAIYLLLLADRLSLDLGTAISEKLAVNAQRYPVSRSRGNATKYRDLS